MARIGLHYQIDDAWALRSGYSWNDSPIPNDQVLFNVLAPAVIRKHITFGISYAPSVSSEVTIGYLHAFSDSQKGTTAFGVPAKIKMHQHAVEIGYSWKF